MHKTKPLILFVPYNQMAHYLRCVEFAKFLRSDFNIIFLRSGIYDKYVSLNDFEITELNADNYSNVIKKAESFDFSWISDYSVRETVDSLIKIISAYKPDFIVGDTYLGLRVASEFLKIKLIAIQNAYVTNFYSELRPVPYNYKAQKYKDKFNPQIWEKIVRTVEKITLKKVHKPFRKLRKSLNLKTYNNLFDEFAGDINLLCDDLEIFPVKDLPVNYMVIGPIMFKSKQDENFIINWIKQKNVQKQF